MIYKLSYLFILFFIYSTLGWIIETIYCSIKSKKVVLNRGFLIGPYCPIYGIASVIMTLFLKEYMNNPILLFTMSIVYTSIIEYITSFIMEKIFKARWWDYSNKKYNLEGRICLENSLFFGLLGSVLVYFINPFISEIIKKVQVNIFLIITLILFIIFIIDFIITFIIVRRLKIKVQNIKVDKTEEMDNQIKEVLRKYRYLYKRLFKAFPKLKFNFDDKHIIVKKIKSRIDEIDKIIKYRKKEIKVNIKNLKIKKESKEKIKIEKKKLKDVKNKI